MDKIILFVGIVVLSIGGILFLNNQTTPTVIKPSITPIPTLLATPSSQPTAQPTPTQEAVTPSQAAIPSTTPTAPVHATLHTSQGDIVLELYPTDAPNTVKNFIKKAQSGFYNNLTFHRVEDWVIQGGDPLGTGQGGGTMPTELNNKPFVVGSLGVARGQDIKVSNDAQFFITKKEASWLNSQYTNFGIVTSGMDVANKIQIGDKILSISVE